MTTKKIALAPAPASTPRASVNATEAALRAAVFERDEIARLSIACAIAGQHVLLLGEPGTGKSYFAEALASAIDARAFVYLMTRTTTPEEIVGAPDMKRWADTGERVLRTAHKLAAADVGFLDEIWKSNGVVLNALLRLLNERTYVDDLGEHRSPLRFVISASNETPEPGEVDAVYDRFLVRYFVEPVQDPALRRAMARRQLPPRPSRTMTLADLDAAKAEASALPVDDAALDALDAVLRDLRAKGIVVSDRRFVATVSLMQALAWMDGRASVSASYVETARHTTWSRVDQRATVDVIVEAHLPKIDSDLTKLAKVVAEQDAAIRAAMLSAAPRAKKQEQLGSVADELDDVVADLDKLAEEHPGAASAIDVVRARAKETMAAANAAVIAAFKGGK